MTRRAFFLLFLLVGCSTSGHDSKFVTCNLPAYEPMMEQAYQSAMKKMAKFFPDGDSYGRITLTIEEGVEIPWARGEYSLKDKNAMGLGSCSVGGREAHIRIAVGPPPQRAQKRLYDIMEHEAAECLRLYHGRLEPADHWHKKFRSVGIFSY